MSIQNQAEFYLRNVYDYDPSLGCNIPISDSLKDGFTQFSSFLLH